MESVDNETQTGGVSRRKMMLGSAAAGGVAWVAPAALKISVAAAASPAPVTCARAMADCPDSGFLVEGVLGENEADGHDGWSFTVEDGTNLLVTLQLCSGDDPEAALWTEANYKFGPVIARTTQGGGGTVNSFTAGPLAAGTYVVGVESNLLGQVEGGSQVASEYYLQVCARTGAVTSGATQVQDNQGEVLGSDVG